MTTLGRLAGGVMQAVDVLRDEHVQRALVLELDERAVRDVRLRVPHLAVAVGSATTSGGSPDRDM